MSKIRVSDIDWDLDDDEGVVLPTALEFELDCAPTETAEIEEFVGDYLSDKFGFCHNGFHYEFI